MAKNPEWIVWSELNGTVEHALIADLGQGSGHGPVGYLAGRLRDKMGPLGLGDLMRQGYVSLSGYRVMTTDCWNRNEARLRREFEKHSRPSPLGERLAELFGAESDTAERGWRTCLGLPTMGRLTEEQIERAFRSTSKQHHPDTGGDREAFIRVQEAREGLLQRIRATL